MLIKVCLLLLSVGVYASYADSSESTTADELFGQLDFVFPKNFLSKFPGEGEFFRLKIITYLFFNLFAKYFGENEAFKFWSKLNRNDFNRVAIDAAFYEYLTNFTDRKTKHFVFNPLESSTSSPEDIATTRIGIYLDNLSADETSADQSEIRSQTTETTDNKYYETEPATAFPQIPSFGIPGKDFPDYYDIPQTSFSCANRLLPGIYADIETGCQVFHVCLPHRMDSFLCPVGTTFNQALLTCDFWHESDCASSPRLFDKPLFLKGRTPRSAEPPISNDESLTTPESLVFTPELDFPEYDATCQSIFGKPLKLHMKFLPEKCEVTILKSSLPKATGKSSNHIEKRYSRLMTDTLSRSFRDLLTFIIKATELGSSETAKMQVAVQQPKLKMKQPSKLHSIILKAATEFASTRDGAISTKSAEQEHPSSTDLPSDEPPPQVNSGFEEKKSFRAASQEKEKHVWSVRRSTLLKPSKPSEESKKHAFDIMMRTMELGGSILNDNVLPFMKTIVLHSHQKMPKSKEI